MAARIPMTASLKTPVLSKYCSVNKLVHPVARESLQMFEGLDGAFTAELVETPEEQRVVGRVV